MKFAILLLTAILLFTIGFLGGVILRAGLQVQQNYVASIKAGYDEDIILTRLMFDFIRSPDRFQQNIEDINSYTIISSYRLMQRPGYELNSAAKSLVSSVQKISKTIPESEGECTNHSIFQDIVKYNGQNDNVKSAIPYCHSEQISFEE